MKNIDSKGDILAFGEFLACLRNRGFAIGVDHHLRLQKLLDKISGDCAPQDLKTLLSPIFATNKNEQEQFYQAFDDYFNLFQVTAAESTLKDDKQSKLPIKYQEPPPLKVKKWPYVIASVLSIILLSAFLLFLSLRNSRPAERSETVAQPAPAESITPSSANTSPVTGERPKQQQAKEGHGDNEAAPTPTPTPTPTPLQTDGSFRDYGVAISSFFRNYGMALRWVMIVTPLILFLFYELYLFKRRKLVLQKQHGKKPPLVWPIQIETAAPKLYDSELFYSAARLMRRRQADAFRQLNIGATVAATVESLGYPNFQYKLHSKPPEYLVLIDRASFRDHQARLFDELTKALEREGLFVVRYFYNGDPRICCDEAGKHCLGLAELHSQFAGHRLILIGDGSRMLDPVSGRLAFWTSIFAEWQDRVLLNPRSPSQWGLFEVTLSQLFAVHPATTVGLLSLVDYFDSTQAKDLRSWKQGDSKGSNLNQPDQPYSVESLRQYLGEETFQWLCACAVYPELQWELTLYLGSLPVMGENLVREENLLRLAGLTWFQTGSIPDNARWRLIQELDRNREMAIRTGIINLLEKNPPPGETFAADTYQLNLVIQRWLHFGDRKRRRQMLEVMRATPQNELLRDYTVLRHLESPAISPLNLALPSRLRRIFYRKGIPAFGLKTGFRLLIALSLMGAGWAITREWQKAEPVAVNNEPQQERPIVYSEMISIPGGTYQMGRTGGLPQEAPAHSVTVTSFSMDKTEVTNAEYLEFVNETNYTPPSNWSGGKPVSGQEQWPVTNVSVDDAKAFAAWRSRRDGVTYRLPTEEEWEYAARNGDLDNLYPWGNQWLSKHAAMVDAGYVPFRSVGSFPDGRNRWGVMDLIGNVWEWTSTKANYYPGSSLQLLPEHKEWMVIRGGSVVSSPRGEKAITAAYRDWLAPTTKNEYLGFRLVRSGIVGQRPSLHDDFSDAKWPTGIYSNGTFFYQNGEYHMYATAKGSVVIYAPNITEYQTGNSTVKVTVRSVDGTSPTYGYGLAVMGELSKKNELEDYSFLIFTGGEPQYKVVLHKGGKETPIVNWTKTATIRAGTSPNNLEVHIQGDQLTFYINGQYATSIKDTANYQRGLVGFYTSDTYEVAFSNLEIYR